MSSNWILYFALALLVVAVFLSIRAYRRARIPMAKYVALMLVAVNVAIMALLMLLDWDRSWATTIAIMSFSVAWILERKSKVHESPAGQS